MNIIVKTLAIGLLFLWGLMMLGCTPGGGTTKSSNDEVMEFPTGRFINEKYKLKAFEFDEDGTWRYYEGNLEKPSVSGKYGINGDLYTEMTHDYPGYPKVPVTYSWTYDGKKLTFHLWGEDVIEHRQGCYDEQTYVNEKDLP